MKKMLAASMLFFISAFAQTSFAKGEGLVHGIYILSESNEVEPVFCTASKFHQAIFILPLNVVKGIDQLRCSQGISTVRVTEMNNDPARILVNIDPPSGVKNTFSCSAKADMGMQAVAINCLRVGDKSTSHRSR
tara:strand:+ start:147 stop:548 length:402 start_codon:yes stop_codon:yes gene_type:complete